MTPAPALAAPSITTQELLFPKAAQQLRSALLHLLRELSVFAAAALPFLLHNSWLFAAAIPAATLPAWCSRQLHPAQSSENCRTAAMLEIFVAAVFFTVWPSTYQLPLITLYVCTCVITAFAWAPVRLGTRKRALCFVALLLLGAPAVAATSWACGAAWAIGVGLVGGALAAVVASGSRHLEQQFASLPAAPHVALSQLQADGDRRTAKRLSSYLADWQASHLRELAAAGEAAFAAVRDPDCDDLSYAAAMSALWEVASLPFALRLPASMKSLRSDAWRVVDFDFEAKTQERDDEERLSYEHSVEWLDDVRAKTAEVLALEELSLETPDEDRAAAAIDARHVRLLRKRLALIEAALAATQA